MQLAEAAERMATLKTVMDYLETGERVLRGMKIPDWMEHGIENMKSRADLLLLNHRAASLRRGRDGEVENDASLANDVAQLAQDSKALAGRMREYAKTIPPNIGGI
jgi:hypothetical protein